MVRQRNILENASYRTRRQGRYAFALTGRNENLTAIPSPRVSLRFALGFVLLGFQPAFVLSLSREFAHGVQISAQGKKIL